MPCWHPNTAPGYFRRVIPSACAWSLGVQGPSFKSCCVELGLCGNEVLSRVLLPSSVPPLTITLCLLQPLSQNHPSGIQPHTQLHLPEGLSLAATSLLTEVRGLSGWGGGRMGLEGPAWVAFQVSLSPHAALPPPFSAAPAVQPKAAFGLWRRWHGKAEVPLLLQHHPVEQAGGLGQLSFPWGAGHTATDPGICDPRWHGQVCLQGEVLPQGGLHMRFCSLSCSSVSACVCVGV